MKYLAFRQTAAWSVYLVLFGVIEMKKTFNALNEISLRGYVAGAALLAPVLSHAQATDPFDTALTTATTKVTSYAGALVGLAAVAVVFMIAIKYVKKIPKAS